MGWSLIHRTFGVFVEFGPCTSTGGLGKKKGKDDKKGPGVPKPGPGDPATQPIFAVHVPPAEGWDDASVPDSEASVAELPFNDPVPGALMSRRKDWSSVRHRREILFSSVATLAEIAPREQASVGSVYDHVPESPRRTAPDWTRDPAKSWPTYDPSRTPGGRP
jgi:hypothetical protein